MKHTAVTLESLWATVGGLRMHARAGGARRHAGDLPVILVHGLVVSSRYMIPTATRLARLSRVYAPDLPGFGKSDHPPQPLDIPGLADALAGWMRAAGIPGAALIGNSLGCQVIADLALRYPALVRCAVLTGPTMDRHGRTLSEQTRRLIAATPYEHPTLLAVQVRDVLSAGLRETVATTYHALADRIEDKLPLIAAPTLVLRGARDPIAPQGWCAELARLLPHGCLRKVPGAGHALNYSRPDALLREALPFLADHGVVGLPASSAAPSAPKRQLLKMYE